MKRLFSKSQKRSSTIGAPASGTVVSSSSSSTAPTVAHASIAGLQPSLTVPPVPHPRPHEYISVLVAEEGILLRPHFLGSEPPECHVRVAWGQLATVEEVDGDGNVGAGWDDALVIYGVLGVVTLFNASYLLIITSRSDIGQLFDDIHKVYEVKGVSAIPLVKERAEVTLNTLKSRNALATRPNITAAISSDVASYIGTPPNSSALAGPAQHVKFSTQTNPDVERPSSPVSASSGASTPTSEDDTMNSPVAKAIADRLSFWKRLSKRLTNVPESIAAEVDQPLLDESETLEEIIKESEGEPAKVIDSILTATAPPPASAEEKHMELEEKVLREVIREFSKGGMYFAYNFDITRSLQHKQEQHTKSRQQDTLLSDLNVLPKDKSVGPLDEKVDVLAEPFPTLPLWRRINRQFWWNEWLLKPFIDAGLHSYVLPIMQGFFQISSFELPEDPSAPDEDVILPIDYMVISRRSRDRAGLRYQRRGVDDEARAANFVETETIMRVQRNSTSNIYSYVQIRGSIPLFWTQSGYSMKPPPLLSPERTADQNLDALKRHFKYIVPKYGPNTIVNLAEHHGKEGALTAAYRTYANKLDPKEVRYVEYDFHQETKGMKYENISHLVDQLGRVFETQGYYWISNSMLMSKQKGVYRVNCIDCLDRTNVVQSALARHVMNLQLGAVGLLNHTEMGRSQVDMVFNDVWANNGDAISREYAGTSALKGDFTRTGKRDLSGLLNDGVNSLARMYSATFSDWFSQTVIDFMLGYRTISVFSEFLLKLQSTDPRELIRLSKIRAEAIATSVARVLEEGESLLSGWTTFAPEELNVKLGDKFEEKILLLSVRALYIVSYDYTLEKVKMYTRVPLGDIVKITKGAYILSPLEETSRDPVQNAGFTIEWIHSKGVTTRMTTYSYRNQLEDTPPPSASIFPAAKSGTLDKRFSTIPGRSFARTTTLSRMMSKVSEGFSNETNFGAFKVLPVDPARIRRESTAGYAEPADDLAGATTCKEVADLMVETIARACEDIGGHHEHFVVDEDVVSVTEAQRHTTMYAKMEYGIKRLLWLGG